MVALHWPQWRWRSAPEHRYRYTHSYRYKYTDSDTHTHSQRYVGSQQQLISCIDVDVFLWLAGAAMAQGGREGVLLGGAGTVGGQRVKMSHAAAAFSSITLQKANTTKDTDRRQQIHLWQETANASNHWKLWLLLARLLARSLLLLLLYLLLCCCCCCCCCPLCRLLAIASRYSAILPLTFYWKLFGNCNDASRTPPSILSVSVAVCANVCVNVSVSVFGICCSYDCICCICSCYDCICSCICHSICSPLHLYLSPS